MAAGKGGGSWRGKERACFSVIVGEAREEGKSCVSLSPWISSLVCYLLTEPLLTAYLSSKESEFILVLPFLFSFL